MTSPTFNVDSSYTVEAQVTHVPPCVPECSTCYPPDEGED